MRLLAALVLVGDASEAPEVLGVKGDFDAIACLLLQSREHLLARLPEDLDPDRRVERLGISCSCSLGNNRNVRLHRGGVRVNLDNRNLISGFVRVLVERDQAWLVGLDEFDETRNARSLAVKSPRLEAIRGDEDQRSLRSASLPVTSPATISVSEGPRPAALGHKAGPVFGNVPRTPLLTRFEPSGEFCVSQVLGQRLEAGREAQLEC